MAILSGNVQGREMTFYSVERRGATRECRGSLLDDDRRDDWMVGDLVPSTI